MYKQWDKRCDPPSISIFSHLVTPCVPIYALTLCVQGLNSECLASVGVHLYAGLHSSGDITGRQLATRPARVVFGYPLPANLFLCFQSVYYGVTSVPPPLPHKGAPCGRGPLGGPLGGLFRARGVINVHYSHG